MGSQSIRSQSLNSVSFTFCLMPLTFHWSLAPLPASEQGQVEDVKIQSVNVTPCVSKTDKKGLETIFQNEVFKCL